ncbi:MAG: hypothetical protein LBN95_01640 [Prevotellaceae bacterium]|nr:hypothetical protein [Prevotellaceae bacterium]
MGIGTIATLYAAYWTRKAAKSANNAAISANNASISINNASINVNNIYYNKMEKDEKDRELKHKIIDVLGYNTLSPISIGNLLAINYQITTSVISDKDLELLIEKMVNDKYLEYAVNNGEIRNSLFKVKSN